YKAIEQLQLTARIVEQLGRQFELAIVYSNLGETYAELYAMDKALEYHQKALELVGLERANADLIRNYGTDLIAVGRTEEGLHYLNLALERAQQTNDPDMIAQVQYSLARYELAMGNLDAAVEHGKALQEIAERLDSLRHRIRGMIILGETSRQKGDDGAARIVFNETSMLAQKSADRSTIWRTHAALASLLQDTMPQVAEIHRRMAAEMMNTILTGIEDEELRAAFQNAAPVQAVLGHDA
ncbi:MAG: hypothetical protein K8S97_13765, partial [Anaerolineae bacterium]|nr:hypothetical protein [Anaerolineae bacterium]